ncbi:hypothetical protein E2542_SST02453 [Spatholobus suberectus]|nr:hypothetical protein E2542_SST02453 [Spatholobus suberectus]
MIGRHRRPALRFPPPPDRCEASPSTTPATPPPPASEFSKTLESDGNMDSVVIGSWKVKESKKRGAKRIRSNWISRIDDEDDVIEGCDRDFDVEHSESRLREQSPVMENLGLDEEREVQHTTIRMRILEEEKMGLGFGSMEDLKDMGINAVGSRRKMFCAIQKLGKGFS